MSSPTRGEKMSKPHCHSGRASLRLIRENQLCKLCDTRQFCEETWHSQEVMCDVSNIILKRKPFEAGERIYKIKDQSKSIFIIKSGIVKVEKVLRDGNYHISGFYFSGDLIGLESVDDEQYNYDAIALAKTCVCEIPLARLSSLDESVVPAQKTIMMLLGKRIRQADDLLTNARYLSAEQRLLIFFEMLCKRYFVQVIDNKQKLQLPMSKGDIASYLGLRPESISRALRKLQNQGVIQNHLKTIEIKDINVAKKMISKL